MLARTYLPLLLVLSIPMSALSQVEPSATGGSGGTSDDTEMMTPPPVSGMPYAAGAGADTRSNFLSASLGVNAGYNDNVLPGSNARPVGDESYWILPAIAFNKSTGRQTVSLGYSPSFTFYQHSTGLNSVNQTASLTFQDRLSPHLSFSVQDYFLRSNDVFSGSYPFSSGNLTGTTQAPVPALIVPYVEQMSDTANGSVDYQIGRDSMIGGGAPTRLSAFPILPLRPDFPIRTAKVVRYSTHGA